MGGGLGALVHHQQIHSTVYLHIGVQVALKDAHLLFDLQQFCLTLR